jgi:hypothetical protein
MTLDKKETRIVEQELIEIITEKIGVDLGAVYSMKDAKQQIEVLADAILGKIGGEQPILVKIEKPCRETGKHRWATDGKNTWCILCAINKKDIEGEKT